jgi:hypothetical protein
MTAAGRRAKNCKREEHQKVSVSPPRQKASTPDSVAPLIKRVLAHEVDRRQLERGAGRSVAVDLDDRRLGRIIQSVDLLLPGGRLGLVRLYERAILKSRGSNVRRQLVAFMGPGTTRKELTDSISTRRPPTFCMSQSLTIPTLATSLRLRTWTTWSGGMMRS